jgi:ATP-dependent Clp protease ATP-binding subunit ClpA
MVDQHLKKAMAEALLFGELRNGGQVLADVNAEKTGLTLSFVPATPSLSS